MCTRSSPTLFIKFMALFLCLYFALSSTATAQQEKPLFSVRGIGGGGGFFSPTFSPYDKNLLFVVCDMGGVYRSSNGGKSWSMLNWTTAPRAAHRGPQIQFLSPSHLLWVQNSYGIMASQDHGITWKRHSETPWYNVPKTNREEINKSYIQSFLPLDSEGNTLLVATGYGLWKGGRKGWDKISEAHCSHLQRIKQDIFYMENGTDLLKSSDNGQSWEKLPLPGKSSAIKGVALKDGSYLFYTAVIKKGIYRSKDGGKTWTFSNNDYPNIVEFIMAPNQDQVAYARQGYPPYPPNLLRTVDGGKIWEPTFRMHDSQTTFWLDVNVEQSWLQKHLHWSYYFTNVSISPFNPKQLMASTQGELFISQNGGDTWEVFFSEKYPPIEGDVVPRHKSIGLEVTSVWGYHFDPHDPQREYIAYTDVGFARSVDQGETWAWSGKGSPWNNTFYDIAFDPKIPGKIFAAASNLHDIPHFVSISAVHPSALVHQGGALVSTDYGKTWKVPYVKSVTLGGLPAQVCTSIIIDPNSPANKRTLYAAVFGEADDEAGVYVSHDEGRTWAKTAGQPGGHNKHIYKLRLHPTTGDLYALITGLRAAKPHYHNIEEGGVWRSSDKGKTWTHISKGSKLNHWATSMTFHPTNPKAMYVTAASPQGIYAGGVYYTQDDGKKWWNILPDKNIKRLTGLPRDYDHWMSCAVHPKKNNILFAGGTNNGLFFSIDGGRRWRWYPEFPFSNVQSITFNPRNTDEVILTTFGSGVWSASLKELLRRYDIDYNKIK